jgi:TRAP-type C4-dicarboxylate transport system permease small subunit
MYVMAVTVLPVRAVLAVLLIFLATCLAWLGLHELDPKELDTRPFTGWRLWIRKVPVPVAIALNIVLLYCYG